MEKKSKCHEIGTRSIKLAQRAKIQFSERKKLAGPKLGKERRRDKQREMGFTQVQSRTCQEEQHAFKVWDWNSKLLPDSDLRGKKTKTSLPPSHLIDLSLQKKKPLTLTPNQCYFAIPDILVTNRASIYVKVDVSTNKLTKA